ncbi:hypothetical protein ACVIF9_008060 [Bradyrhizobium sp. USDA 4350]
MCYDNRKIVVDVSSAFTVGSNSEYPKEPTIHDYASDALALATLSLFIYAMLYGAFAIRSLL